MSILFDKCNVNVFLDISKCMITSFLLIIIALMVLHNLLKAIRDDNSVVYYHSYPRSFYEKVYSVCYSLYYLIHSPRKSNFSYDFRSLIRMRMVLLMLSCHLLLHFHPHLSILFHQMVEILTFQR